MATQLAITFKLALAWVYRNELDLGEVTDNNSLTVQMPLSQGTGLDQVDLMFHDRRTLAGSASENLDLAGALSNSFGQTLTFAKLKGIAVRNRSTTAGVNLVLGGGDNGAGNNAFASWLNASGDKLTLGPGGVLVLINPALAGYAVTAGTGDILRISNTGGSSADYDLVLIGTSV